MKIVRVETRIEPVPLTRSYTVAYGTRDACELAFCRIVTDGALVGDGSGTPAPQVTGESVDDTRAAFESFDRDRLVGRDPRELGTLLDALPEGRPAARAAIELALYDLFARINDVRVVDLFGARHDGLATSVTCGIDSAEATLELADEYLAAGFRCLKVKIGLDLAADVDRLERLRDRIGRAVTIRVDANQGYSPEEAVAFAKHCTRLEIELVEQPMKPELDDRLDVLDAPARARVALDESVQAPADALRLATAAAPCGIFNIKVQKSGGLGPAGQIATIAEIAGRELMWGCMDESRLAIAGSLHRAYASPATRYLDLDGSLDLARDPAAGGFSIEEGRMYLLDRPGLGCEVEA